MTNPSNASPVALLAPSQRDAVGLHHQFETLPQQHEAAILGIWTFLATEVLFFGGALVAYAIYRYHYQSDFAFASHHLSETLGSINTAILLTSSLTVALAVHFAHHKNPRAVQLALAATIALGLAFICIKATEYKMEYDDHLIPAINFTLPPQDPIQPNHVQLFMLFYFILTLIHATHMLIGLVLLTLAILHTTKPHHLDHHPNTIEVLGLYWHFVDLVWIFLFPLLYLVR